jgi:long-chain fatty acid transport protein
MKKHAILTLSLLLPAVMALSAGFQISFQGLRQVAMAGSGTAWAWDASTIFYNPAGLSRLKSVQAYGSVMFLIPNTRYTETVGSYSTDSKSAVYTPFNVYVGGPIKKDSKFGVGIGIYTPFGSGMNWDDDWAGRYVIQKVSLSTIFIQPTVSYRFNEAISAGAGFVYGFGNVHFQRAIPIQDLNGNDGSGELKGKANGVGFNLGVHIKATEKLQFGINYRSEVKMKVKEGDATFVVPQTLADSFPSGKFSTTVAMPQVVSFGVGYKPMEKLTLLLDVKYTVWNTYDTLKFDYETNTSILQDTKAPRGYKNTTSIHLGGHYQVNNMLAVMLGGAYDPTPVQDGLVSPDLPDGNRILINGGLSLRPTRKLSIIAALEYGLGQKRNAEYVPDHFNGKYQTKAVVPCIGVTYDF